MAQLVKYWRVQLRYFRQSLKQAEKYDRINQTIKICSGAKGMSKTAKSVVIILSIAVAFIIGAYLFIGALWNGAFNFIQPKEIRTYNSPDGKYSLVFEQMGDPQWPFGPTDVRLTLKTHDGKNIERVSTQLSNDGVNASEYNIASISWNDDAVIVILRASEMKDKEISIAYSKR